MNQDRNSDSPPNSATATDEGAAEAIEQALHRKRIEGVPYAEKPPLGLSPAFVYLETRRGEIIEAMRRYSVAKKPIPVVWVEELTWLVQFLDRVFQPSFPNYPKDDHG